jgi:PKD repeat protein
MSTPSPSPTPTPTPSPTPAPSYPFPDLTLPPHTILMNLLNEVNAARLPEPLTTDVCVWGDPSPYGANGANTQIPFGTSNPTVFGTGTVMVKYNRIDVSQVVAANQPATEASQMSGVLAALNAEYGLNLQASDIVNSAITDGVGTLTITNNNLIYTGAIQITFSSSTPTPSPVPTPTPTPAPAPVVSFQFLVDDGNPLEVHFTDTSNDEGSTVTGWAWNFGDSSGTSTEQNPSYTYAAAGTFNVTLAITDGNGTHTSTAVPVTVVAAPAPSPD